MSGYFTRTLDLDLGLFVRRLTLILEQCAKQHNTRDHLGGYLCVAHEHTGIPFELIMIGTIPLDKQPLYVRFSMEKAKRLASIPAHISSFQSKNASRRQYPGAVKLRGAGMIFSFSGLDALLDEAICAVLAYLVKKAAGDADADAYPRSIKTVSNNPYILPMLEAIRPLAF